MSPPTQDDLQAFVTADYLTLAALLDELPDARWGTRHHCVRAGGSVKSSLT